MRLHYALEDSSKSPHMEALQRPCRIIHCLLFDHHYEYVDRKIKPNTACTRLATIACRNRGFNRPEGAIPWRLLTWVDPLNNNVREAWARRSDE